MVNFSIKGNWKKTDTFFERALELFKLGRFDKYGEMGVRALMNSTPRDTGKTAGSWYYKISRQNGGLRIDWCNDNITQEGTPVAVLLQYGHGTSSGAFVMGTDFINPAMKDIFSEIAEEAWKEVIK